MQEYDPVCLMSNVVRFPRSNRRLARPDPQPARSAETEFHLQVLRELSERGMILANQAAERVRNGDLSAALEFADIAEEVCCCIELEHEIRTARPVRYKIRPSRPPKRTH